MKATAKNVAEHALLALLTANNKPTTEVGILDMLYKFAQSETNKPINKDAFNGAVLAHCDMLADGEYNWVSALIFAAASDVFGDVSDKPADAVMNRIVYIVNPSKIVEELK
jgi:hypothetical protein